MHRLRRKKLSPNQVRRLIFDLALLGQFTKPYLDTEDEVIDFFNRQDDTQYYFDIIVEQCRDYSELVPLIEDAFGSANNSEVGKFNGKVLLSKEEILVEAPGILHMNHHLFLFSYSFNKLNIGIDYASILDIQAAIVFGIASIESFINEKAQRWNRNYPEDTLIDTKENKIPFIKKIDEWIPKFTCKNFDKTGEIWNHFQSLQNYRDNEIIHSSNSAFGITFKEIVELINRYKAGIAAFHKELHLLFEQHVPHMIIRAMHFPAIEIIDD